MNAAVYLRISADREGLELGVARQLEDCRGLAERLGLEVVQVYKENDVSASTNSTKRRPLYAEMLARARAGDSVRSSPTPTRDSPAARVRSRT